MLYKLGLSYYAFNKFKKCIKTLKQALMNKPYLTYEADIYYHIGLSYCNLEKFEKSIYPYSRVSHLLPITLGYSALKSSLVTLGTSMKEPKLIK